MNDGLIHISIVIPLYNKERSIVSTIESVISQTYKEWELIIVDDGSTDNSLNVVKEFVGQIDNRWIDDRLTLIHKENGGVCSARNRGIQEANGEYLALLDGDDLWDKEYLSEQVKMIHDFPEAVMWSINYAETNQGKIVRYLPTGLPAAYRGYVDDYFQNDARKSDLFHSSSVVILKNVFDIVGYFDERIRYGEDNDMWWRIIATHRVAFYDRYMVYYRWDSENRALTGRHPLRYDVEFFVDKYRVPQFKQNTVFYKWVNRRSAQWIARVLFSSPTELKEAKEAASRLDFSQLQLKYWVLFRTPYWFSSRVYRMLQKKNEKK